MCMWFSNFFENALVNLVKRRICIRMVRFWRSTNDVLMCFSSGRPSTVRFTMPVQSAGL